MTPPANSAFHRNSAIAAQGDQTTRTCQSSSQNRPPEHQPTSPPSTRPTSSQSDVSNSPPNSKYASDSMSTYDDPLLPKTRATRRDKFIGGVGKIVGKAVRDPELHERGALRAAGGKDLADGLAMVDSKSL